MFAFRYGAGWLASRPVHDAKEQLVSHYPVEDLIVRWKREELTPEQMIGQVLQVLYVLEQRLRVVERRVPENEEKEGSAELRQRQK